MLEPLDSADRALLRLLAVLGALIRVLAIIGAIDVALWIGGMVRG